MAYATSSRSKRNVDEMRRYGIGLLLQPNERRLWPGFKYGIDNGAFSAWNTGKPWREAPWLRLLRDHGAGAEWAVLPDIVNGGAESLALSLRYLQQVRDMTRRHLIAVQDGMTADDIRPHVGEHVGIFVGGSTEFKEGTLPMWGRLAAEMGCYLHVGRVNTQRRIKLCAMAGADSFDGTTCSRFSYKSKIVGTAARQGAFLWDL